MKKRKNDFELDLEEYVDDDYDESFYSVSNDLTAEEQEYSNFFKVDSNIEDENEFSDNDYIVDDYEEEYENDHDSAYTYDSSSSLYKFLSLFLTVFKWLGIAIAVILIAYFITQGKIKSLLLYIIGLVVAFFFGYFFMYLLNKFTEE